MFLTIKASLKVLKANKNRAFLTMLGIIIGVAAVIVIMSVGAGAQNLIFDQITASGTNLIGILPGFSDEKGPPASVMGITVTTLKTEDAEALKKIKEITAVTSYVRGLETVQWQNQKIETTYVGTSSEYPQLEAAKVKLGNFFDESQDKSLSRVAVLGWQIGQDLFGQENPLNQEIKIKRESFRVIGVMEKRGVQSFQNQDALIFVPLKTAQKLLLGINHVSLIRAKLKDENEMPVTISRVKQLLRERHHISDSQLDDFTVRAAVQALDVLRQITQALSFFLSAIAAISLIVGGVGIMNIMLVGVNERTREIGLRKALGASPANIQTQFFTEALTLTVLAGIVGILTGILISGLIAIVANYLGYHWGFIITLPSILLGVGVAGLVGIVFGWYPARRAAQLEPVEALRYE